MGWAHGAEALLYKLVERLVAVRALNDRRRGGDQADLKSD
jgi:hypothetical protein